MSTNSITSARGHESYHAGSGDGSSPRGCGALRASALSKQQQRPKDASVIVFNLGCDHDHVFEGWFASSNAFEDQCRRGLISCPVCGSTAVTRRLSAPHLRTDTKRTEAAPATRHNVVAALTQALRHAARHSEDVGERFPDEARRIHYGETEARAIRGRADGDDIGELLEEGILVLPVPDEPDLQ